MGKTYRSNGRYLVQSSTGMRTYMRHQMRLMSKREFTKSVNDYEMNGDCSYSNTVRSSFKIKNHGMKVPLDFNRLTSIKMEIAYNNNVYSDFDHELREYLAFVAAFRYNHEKDVRNNFAWTEQDSELRHLFMWEVLNVYKRESDNKCVVGGAHQWFKNYRDHPMLRQLERRGRIGIFKKHSREKTHIVEEESVGQEEEEEEEESEEDSYIGNNLHEFSFRF